MSAAEESWRLRFCRPPANSSLAWERAREQVGTQRGGLDGSALADPEVLLSLSHLLRLLCESNPTESLQIAEALYASLRKVNRPEIAAELAHFRGEFALIAGGASRFLARRQEALVWFDRAEALFSDDDNATAQLGRVAYQRLALLIEERKFEEVEEAVVSWRGRFSELGLLEEVLKCRFLEATILKETERLDSAVTVFEELRKEAEAQSDRRLAAIASQNLFQIHAFRGNAGPALIEARAAEGALCELESWVHLAKLPLGIGFLLRAQGKLQESISAFRESQARFAKLGMSADVAAVHLILADLMLDSGQAVSAEAEIKAALPVIDEYQLVPEGVAALSLLRESLRRRQVDRRALRDLHGYLRNPSG